MFSSIFRYFGIKESGRGVSCQAGTIRSLDRPVKERVMTKLYVGNLSYGTTEDRLRQKFEEFGAVESVNIVKDRETGRSKGFGFVEMVDENDANSAIEKLNSSDLDGRTMTVSNARPRQDRPSAPRGGSGGGRSSSSYGSSNNNSRRW